MREKTYFGTKERKNLNEFEKESIENYQNKFAKWQGKQIDLLTFCINLNFTISIAISGFIISNQEKAIFKDKVIYSDYSLISTSLFLLAITSTIGILALITRLNDFRLTKNTIKFKRRIFEIDNNIKYEDYKQSKLDTIKKEKQNSKYWSNILGIIT